MEDICDTDLINISHLCTCLLLSLPVTPWFSFSISYDLDVVPTTKYVHQYYINNSIFTVYLCLYVLRKFINYIILIDDILLPVDDDSPDVDIMPSASKSFLNTNSILLT